MKRILLLATIALLFASSGCCRPLLRRPLFPLLRSPCIGTEVYGDGVLPNSSGIGVVEEVPNP